ncbi:MAG: hypothetical protein F4Z24_07225 [Nitrospira sp. SB0666_bin_27]|nr:hypothetical protein [Nitrospira sp. SB0666_bin_27]MYF25508.1 hypothetical protein [Nitrospira sp. SB0678_bin_10]
MNWWPWSKREKRESGGDFSDAVVRLIEAQATGTAADASSTAAVEAASGALSRAFMSAMVDAETYAKQAITPVFLSQVGRDLIRHGDSMHVIDVDAMGQVALLPCSSWHFEGNAHPNTWTVRATVYGPSTSMTRHLPFSSVVFVKWGSTPGQPYIGTGPLLWASTTARLQAETERALADETGNAPLAQLIPVPQDGGDGGEDDPLKLLKADLARARGKAMLVETTAAGWGEGKQAAPTSDYKAARLGPQPHPVQATIRKETFGAVLAACGISESLFIDADGTAQREALRRWHMNVVMPLAHLLEYELTMKLETDVTLTFDKYPMDMVSRATTFQKYVAGGMPVVEAVKLSGVLVGDEE